jgi:hypothetical protein
MKQFDKFISPEPKSGCWLWSGTVVRGGYGRIKFRRRYHLAHRVSFILHCGEIPEGIDVCHKCDVPYCVNPEHLFLASHAENMADMVRKGRQAVGTRQGNAKLTPWQIMTIRAMKTSQRAMARKFQVSRKTIQKVQRGMTWRHLVQV